jgi:hypothetical protein
MPANQGNSDKKTSDDPRDPGVHLAFLAFNALVDSPGRRGVRIFGLPREQLIMAAVASFLFVIPLTIVVGMMPFWDRLGELTLLKQLNYYVAPEIYHLDYGYRARAFPRLPLKRFLTASAFLLELTVLSNIVALFSRGVRKHALLVWTCYDRTKILQYFGISALIFCGLWYVLFFDWTFFTFVNESPQAIVYVYPYLVMAMPFVALVFGHMATIVGLGCWRIASRKLRRFRKAIS